jgi:SLT domain-containing protein
MTDALLTDIERFLNETGMGEYRFGLKAARNGRLVERLRQGTTPERGKPVWIRPETERQIRDFMAAERARREIAA